MMAEMREFDVVQVARSDGADTGPGYWPTQQAMSMLKETVREAAITEKTPRAKPQMTRLDENDPRFIEWRVKLGILLKQELSPKPDEGSPWYVQFPQGYWLYEKSKHLWVSGYPIKAKLFKTPQEFGLHLIWLLSSSQDYTDCCCVHCNMPSLSAMNKAAANANEDTLTIIGSELHEPSGKLQKVSPVPIPNIPGQPAARKPAKSTTPVPVSEAKEAPAVKPKAKAKTQGQQAKASSKASGDTRSQQSVNVFTDQLPLSLSSPILYRVGELVWYQTGNTWRLGIITTHFNGGHDILPIGYGSIMLPNVGKRDVEMRPFHAFSVPPVTVPELADKTFDDIPFSVMLQSTGADTNKRDILLLDASKLGATRIDQSLSLWSSRSPTTQPIVTYQGMFLGAERFEVGDCAHINPEGAPHLSNANTRTIMAIQYIFVNNKDFPGSAFVRGPVYAPVMANTNIPTEPENQLPAALRDEAQWQGQVNPAQALRYAVLDPDFVIKVDAVKGRYYPMHRLMPILDPARFQAAVANRSFEGLEPHLNSRPAVAVLRRSRMDALGASVPPVAIVQLESFIREG